MRARLERIFAFVLAASVAASAAYAADSIELARKLVRYTGGVSLILRNFEGGMAASVPAPDIFRQSFEQALADNGAASSGCTGLGRPQTCSSRVNGANTVNSP